jgi:hypothetical protein
MMSVARRQTTTRQQHCVLNAAHKKFLSIKIKLCVRVAFNLCCCRMVREIMMRYFNCHILGLVRTFPSIDVSSLIDDKASTDGLMNERNESNSRLIDDFARSHHYLATEALALVLPRILSTLLTSNPSSDINGQTKPRACRRERSLTER